CARSKHQHFLHLFDSKRPDYDLMVNASSCNRIPAAQVKNWVPEPWRCLSVPPSLDAVDIPTVQNLVEFAQVPDAIYLIDPSICPPTRCEIQDGMLVAGAIFLPYTAFLLWLQLQLAASCPNLLDGLIMSCAKHFWRVTPGEGTILVAPVANDTMHCEFQATQDSLSSRQQACSEGIRGGLARQRVQTCSACRAAAWSYSEWSVILDLAPSEAPQPHLHVDQRITDQFITPPRHPVAVDIPKYIPVADSPAPQPPSGRSKRHQREGELEGAAPSPRPPKRKHPAAESYTRSLRNESFAGAGDPQQGDHHIRLQAGSLTAITDNSAIGKNAEVLTIGVSIQNTLLASGAQVLLVPYQLSNASVEDRTMQGYISRSRVHKQKGRRRKIQEGEHKEHEHGKGEEGDDSLHQHFGGLSRYKSKKLAATLRAIVAHPNLVPTR
ncbi:hypothetical protein OBBRIDRAFT_808671, partial [Obba rivulosa]